MAERQRARTAYRERHGKEQVLSASFEMLESWIEFFERIDSFWKSLDRRPSLPYNIICGNSLGNCVTAAPTTLTRIV